MFRDFATVMNTINSGDLQRPNIFEVIFKGLPIKNQLLVYSGVSNNSGTETFAAYSPRLIQTVYGAVQDNFLEDMELKYKNMDLGLYVKAVKIPDTRLSYEYNYAQRLPAFKLGREELSELTITFYLDARGVNRIFFQKWIECIINSETGLMAFVKSVCTDVEVIMYTRTLTPVTSTIMKDCMPVAITEPQLDYEGNNQIAVFDVTFIYKNKTSVSLDMPEDPTKREGVSFT